MVEGGGKSQQVGLEGRGDRWSGSWVEGGLANALEAQSVTLFRRFRSQTGRLRTRSTR